MLLSLKTDQRTQDTKKMQKELKTIDKRLTDISAILKRLYEDLALGKINEDRYQEMYHGFDTEEKELRHRQENLKTELEKNEETFSNAEKFVPLIKKYTDIQELNAYILNELIEKIVVHEKMVDQDGNKTQKVEIHYKFVGYIGI